MHNLLFSAHTRPKVGLIISLTKYKAARNPKYQKNDTVQGSKNIVSLFIGTNTTEKHKK